MFNHVFQSNRTNQKIMASSELNLPLQPQAFTNLSLAKHTRFASIFSKDISRFSYRNLRQRKLCSRTNLPTEYQHVKKTKPAMQCSRKNSYPYIWRSFCNGYHDGNMWITINRLLIVKLASNTWQKWIGKFRTSCVFFGSKIKKFKGKFTNIKFNSIKTKSLLVNFFFNLFFMI